MMDNREASKIRYVLLTLGGFLLIFGSALLDWRISLVATGIFLLLLAVMNRISRLLMIISKNIKDWNL